MFSLFDHGAVHLGSRSFVQRGENSIEPVLFSMSFAFMPYGHKADECNMTCPIAHEANRCTFLISCTVSWKRPFLLILRNFGHSWLTEMLILVGGVLHTGT